MGVGRSSFGRSAGVKARGRLIWDQPRPGHFYIYLSRGVRRGLRGRTALQKWGRRSTPPPFAFCATRRRYFAASFTLTEIAFPLPTPGISRSASELTESRRRSAAGRLESARFAPALAASGVAG